MEVNNTYHLDSTVDNHNPIIIKPQKSQPEKPNKTSKQDTVDFIDEKIEELIVKRVAHMSINEKVNVFQGRLIKDISKKHAEENILLSPLSISSTINTLIHVCENENQKNALLNFAACSSENEQELHTFWEYFLTINKQVICSQLVYLNPAFKVRNQFLEVMKLYDAKIAVGESAREINQWVAKRTNNEIAQIIQQNEMTRSILTLVDAIFFKSPWITPFEGTKTLEFTNIGNTKTKISMMCAEGKFGYAKVEGSYSALKLPMENGSAALVVVPEKLNSFPLLLNDLEFPVKLLEEFEDKNVSAYIPEFKIEHMIDLKKLFAELDPQMGKFMIQPDLSGAIDYTHKTPEAPEISQLTHKATMHFGAEGIRASAVTIVQIMERGGGSKFKEDVEFRADKPFLVYTVDQNGFIQFFAQVVDPTVNKLDIIVPSISFDKGTNWIWLTLPMSIFKFMPNACKFTTLYANDKASHSTCKWSYDETQASDAWNIARRQIQAIESKKSTKNQGKHCIALKCPHENKQFTEQDIADLLVDLGLIEPSEEGKEVSWKEKQGANDKQIVLILEGKMPQNFDGKKLPKNVVIFNGLLEDIENVMEDLQMNRIFTENSGAQAYSYEKVAQIMNTNNVTTYMSEEMKQRWFLVDIE